jgi:hypothetical protein
VPSSRFFRATSAVTVAFALILPFQTAAYANPESGAPVSTQPESTTPDAATSDQPELPPLRTLILSKSEIRDSLGLVGKVKEVPPTLSPVGGFVGRAYTGTTWVTDRVGGTAGQGTKVTVQVFTAPGQSLKNVSLDSIFASTGTKFMSYPAPHEPGIKSEKVISKGHIRYVNLHWNIRDYAVLTVLDVFDGNKLMRSTWVQELTFNTRENQSTKIIKIVPALKPTISFDD